MGEITCSYNKKPIDSVAISKNQSFKSLLFQRISICFQIATALLIKQKSSGRSGERFLDFRILKIIWAVTQYTHVGSRESPGAVDLLLHKGSQERTPPSTSSEPSRQPLHRTANSASECGRQTESCNNILRCYDDVHLENEGKEVNEDL